jgi:hypothetical protein
MHSEGQMVSPAFYEMALTAHMHFEKFETDIEALNPNMAIRLGVRFLTGVSKNKNGIDAQEYADTAYRFLPALGDDRKVLDAKSKARQTALNFLRTETGDDMAKQIERSADRLKKVLAAQPPYWLADKRAQ